MLSNIEVLPENLEEQEMPHIVASVSIVKIMKSYMFPRVSI
jgi:hypothetical protein